MSITINKIGTLATIQDYGRVGYQAQGVPLGGAMDEDAFTHANLLVGNTMHEASLEIASGSLELKFNEDCVAAITGSGTQVTCENRNIPFSKRIGIRAGATIRFSASGSGCWTYLSVAGGLKVDPVMGSRSTYLPAHFGGFHGRPLKKGDQIELNQSTLVQIPENQWINEPSWGIAVSNHSGPIRIFQGPEWNRFTDEVQHQLFEKAFKISPDSNRMGYRISGQSLKLRDKTELISTPVTRGTIQVANDGTPIILMADAQTIGGYPRIAQVAAVDIPQLAQKRPGESIKFEFISYDEACQLFLKREQEWRKTETSIRLKQK